MEEIYALQRELAALQETKDTLRLSERNVIDLLLKLQEMKLVDVIYTSNAKTIITKSQLKKEIKMEIASHLGRVSLQDLHEILNVDISYIELFANEIADESMVSPTHIGQVRILGGELISDMYLDGIMEDTNEALQEIGQITLGELAQQYGFSVEFIKDVIDKRMHSILKAKLKGNTLFTDAFVLRQNAQVRGIFSAITRPTYLPEIVATTGIEEQILTSVLMELINSDIVHGALRGREFVPHIFIDVQRDALHSFFTTNGYMSYSHANQLQLNGRPYEFLKKSFPDCLDLENFVVSHAVLLQLEASLSSLHQDIPWLDARSVAPLALDVKNTELLLREAIESSKKKNLLGAPALQIGRIYAVNSNFIADVKGRFAAHSTNLASEAALNSLQSKHTSINEPTSLKKTQSKKKNDKRGDQAMDICPFQEDQVELLMNWFDHCDGEKEFCDELLDHLQNEIKEIYSTSSKKAVASIHRGASYTRQELLEKFEAQFEILHDKLLIHQKSHIKLTALLKGEINSHAIEKAWMTSNGLELCSLTLMYLNEWHELDLNGIEKLSSSDQIQNIPVLSEPLQEILTKKLPFGQIIIDLWDLAIKASLNDFLSHIPQVAEALSMPLRKLDRKKERAFAQTFKQNLIQRYDNAQDLYEVISIVSSLVFQALTTLPLELPSSSHVLDTFPPLNTIFESKLPTKANAQLAHLIEVASQDPSCQSCDSALLESIKVLAMSKNWQEFMN